MKNFRLLLLCCCALPCLGLRGGYEKATVVSMRRVNCDIALAAQRNAMSQMMGIPAGSPMAADAGDCMEYELESAKVKYVIRPRKEILLPLGQELRIQFVNRDLLIHNDGEKDIKCAVTEMRLRSRDNQSHTEMNVSDTSPYMPPQQTTAPRAATRNCLSPTGDVVQCPAGIR